MYKENLFAPRTVNTFGSAVLQQHDTLQAVDEFFNEQGLDLDLENNCEGLPNKEIIKYFQAKIEAIGSEKLESILQAFGAITKNSRASAINEFIEATELEIYMRDDGYIFKGGKYRPS